MIVLLILDDQFAGAGAGYDAGGTSQIAIPGAEPVGLCAPTIVAKVLEAAHEKFWFTLGPFDDGDAMLAHLFCKK